MERLKYIDNIEEDEILNIIKGAKMLRGSFELNRR